jgi:hypothetical protein
MLYVYCRVLDLLPAGIFFLWQRDCRSRLVLLGKREKAAELSGGILR